MFFWLIGDRFACLDAKNRIIKKLRLSSPWGIRLLEPCDTANEFCLKISENEFFGEDNLIYVCLDPIPEPNKTTDFINNLPEHKCLILIEEKVDRRTKMFKKLGSLIKEFPIIKDSRGIIQKKLIPNAKKIVKSISDWKGPEDIFDKIFHQCDYDYGKTVNEIEKIKIYLNSDSINLADNIDEILSIKETPDIDLFIEALNRKEKKQAFFYCEKMLNNPSIEDNLILIISALIENYMFLFHYRSALDQKITNDKQIGEYISNIWYKNGRPVDPVSTSNRLYFYKEIIRRMSIDYIANAMLLLGWAFEEAILKNVSHRQVLRRITYKILK